jgi:hypothetical protein
MRILAIGAAVMALSGCATGPIMDVAQCQTADWRQIGYQDGANGHDPSRFVARDQACMTAGFASDQGKYQEGFGEGVRVYCTPSNGFRVAMNGQSYSGQCPADLDQSFRTAYSDGRIVYEATSALRAAESALNSLRSDRDRVESKLAQNEAGFAASQTDAERERHRNEIFRFRSERNRIEDRIRDQERELRWRSQEVSRLRFQISSPYGSW